jgi:hypothetical protein
MYVGVDALTHVFLTLALVRGERSASCPSRYALGERIPGTLSIGGCVGPGKRNDEC